MLKKYIMADDTVKENKKEYLIVKTVNVGTKKGTKKGEPKKVLKRGEEISLTLKEAQIYKSQNII